MNQVDFFARFGVVDMEGAFGLGAFFVIFIMLLLIVADIPGFVYQWLHQRRVLHFCSLRYFSDDIFVSPCHERSCPHRMCCRFYRPRPSLWSRLRNWVKKEP